MFPGASPDRRTVVRVSVDEQVTLFVHSSLPDLPPQRETGIPAKLIDASPCGVRVRHTEISLGGRGSALLHCTARMIPVHAVWTANLGRFFETGFLTEEALLLARLRAGETDALLPLMRPYLAQIKSAIRSIVRDATDAEDVLQESLLKVIAHATQFHPGQSFKAWLLQIATHEALKLLRSKKRRLQFIQTWADDDDAEIYACCVDLRGSPADALRSAEYEAAFSAALGSLDEIYKQVFILRQIQRRSMAEIATELGINIDTANTRLHRARLRLYFQLQNICPSPGSSRAKVAAR